jgi:hypothetical protein
MDFEFFRRIFFVRCFLKNKTNFVTKNNIKVKNRNFIIKLYLKTFCNINFNNRHFYSEKKIAYTNQLFGRIRIIYSQLMNVWNKIST